MKRLAYLTITAALIAMAAWLLPFCREQRRLYYRDYTFSREEARQLARHPDILYAHGRHAEAFMDTAGAMAFYGRVTALNALHMGAWLRLADLAAGSGDQERARRITSFCDTYIGPVLRWKWPHTLLAHGLGMEKIFSANINYLAARRAKLNDALTLLDTHCQGSPEKALALLQPDNHPAYLAWAMRWNNAVAARAAWKEIDSTGSADAGLMTDYVHYLVSHKMVLEAAAVWQKATGHTGVTNGGFEEDITGKGFDWRVANDRSGHWDVRRQSGAGLQGGTALHIRFNGQTNAAFHHVRQIIPVTPDAYYRLTFWWRAKALTTDQVPRVEVYGYDAAGLRVRSEELRGSDQWRQAEVAFRVPAGCHAVVVAVRRQTSRRFDSKIRGSVWLDGFSLHEDRI